MSVVNKLYSLLESVLIVPIIYLNNFFHKDVHILNITQTTQELKL